MAKIDMEVLFMKKFLSLLLAASMVFGLAACSDGGTTTSSDTSGASGASSETSSDAAPVETRPNRVIYGSTTGISGDFADYEWWTNNADDKTARRLFNDYGTVVSDQGGGQVINSSVCDGVESAENEDGSKTFTVKIKQGLKWNNGEDLKADAYVAYALVTYSKAMKDAGASVSTDIVVGTKAYQNGEVNYISGIHLVDEYTYSIQISADYVPYYFEINYASLMPIYMPQYASAPLVVKDDGEGAYFEGGELVPDELKAVRELYEGRVSCGPYQIVSVDTAAYEAVFEINPYYAGNFEGQKPSIEQVIMKKTITETEFDALQTGAVDILTTLTTADEINKSLDLVEAGGYANSVYSRAGYGMIQFQCDFGPTQFTPVRQAIALLLDRNEFIKQYAGGYASIVNGPYGQAMWMVEESEEVFAEKMNNYEYNPEEAVKLLEADGWTLNEDGTPYSGTGVRYKEVTPEEAGDYALNVTLADGRILMPLHIKWSTSEANPVSELLKVLLSEGQQVADAGMVIEPTVMTFDELLLYLYRDRASGNQYAVPTYGMYNLASNFPAGYEWSYTFTTDPELVANGRNQNYLLDEELDKLSMDMVYGVEPGDDEAFLKYFQDFMIRWNSLLPDIPLYSNTYYTVFPDWLEGYVENSYWGFENAVLYASVAGAE